MSVLISLCASIIMLGTILTFSSFAATSSSGGKSQSTSRTKVFPLPTIGYTPTEDFSYGVMLIVMTEDAKRTTSLLAPTYTKNKIIGHTGTFRLFWYPSATSSFSFIPSISSRVNRNASIKYSQMQTTPGTWTTDFEARALRDIFYRFFGFGPMTKRNDESGYTRVEGKVSIRQGLNLTSFMNLAVKSDLQRVIIQDMAPEGVERMRDKFPNAPNTGPSTVSFQGLSLRLDTRPNSRHSYFGVFSELTGGMGLGVTGSSSFRKVESNTVFLIPHTKNLTGAYRFYFGMTEGKAVPFYHQITFGGSEYMRGYPNNRFIDARGWTADFEERYSLARGKIMGTYVDFQLTPFITLGQVYENKQGMFKSTKFTGGLGLRAFVVPNMVGRLDIAKSGDGIATYLELGYPF